MFSSLQVRLRTARRLVIYKQVRGVAGTCKLELANLPRYLSPCGRALGQELLDA